MAQIFPRSANAWAKASILTALFLAGGAGYALWRIAHSGYVTRQGVVLQQPPQPAGQVGGVLRLDQQATARGLDQLRERAVPRLHHRHAVGQRLQHV